MATWNTRRSGGEPPVEPAAPADKPEKAGKADVVFETEPSRGRPPNAGQRASFDFYLLSLTSHPAFCADGHSRQNECRAGKSPPISIHGLWPERREPGKYPRDCAGPPLDLDPTLESKLAPLMPGMADGLHKHEWRKHGTCSGLDDDDYFGFTLVMANAVDQALGARLTNLAGQRSSAAALREYADEKSNGMGATLTFHCRTLRDAPAEHRREPYLVEIRRCIAGDNGAGKPGAPVSCASVNRRDQGCGSGFRIAE